MQRSFGRLLLISAAAAVALGTAFAAPASADDYISTKIAMPDVMVGAGASAEARPIIFANEQRIVDPVELTFELSGALDGVQLVPPKENWGCSNSDPKKIICWIPPWGLLISPYGNDDVYASIAADAAALGETGKLTVSFSGGGAKPSSLTVDVSVVDGVDLAAGDSQTVSVKPGATFDAPLQVHNNTDSVVHGAAITVDTRYPVTAAKQFSNCYYRAAQSNACVFDQDLDPGATYQVVLPFRLRGDTYAPGKIVSDFNWLTGDDYQNQMKFIRDNGFEGPGTAGTGPKLELKRTGTMRSLAKQTDTKPGDNRQSLTVDVTGKQGADLAAIGTTASGAAGTTVALTVGLRNNGPATFVADRDEGDGVIADVTLPAGTTLVTKPGNCYDSAYPLFFTCEVTPEVFPAKTSVTWTFKVRITKVVSNAQGSVKVDDRLPISKDTNVANNVAKIVLNPVQGAGGGDGGGLPITGPQTAVIGAAGAALVAAGLLGFVVARRRRTRFEA